MTVPAPGPYHFGTAIVIGEKAVLLVGASRSGKSGLAERLIAEARQRGRFAMLVGDDRVAVRLLAGRLVVSAHPAIFGQIERRTVGIAEVAALPAAVLAAVISIEPYPARLPEPPGDVFEVEGIRLPVMRLRDDQDLCGKAYLALDWIAP